MSTHIVAFKSVAADRDRPNGAPLVRTVTVGAQTASVVCHFQSPWRRDAADAFLVEAATELSVPASDLIVREVTVDQYRAIENQVSAPIRAAREADEQAKADAYRAEARTLLESIGFSADGATRRRQIRALAFALRKVIRSVDEEVGDKE